MVILGINLFY